ncbi:DUF4398 domain-containing protein [Thiohalophilus sp.]|uniref:DUF4398 domain-containing protein n=1 Tax=Thiohalophilus sp. TaxID=3028392 RepID=UPI002ACE33DE|nr:DUF4398 domain-containing protein [Thiohalophilus sp.]MDZ7805336.1 DUF4398 domain-containing protein [Thiohalophilus sp.]
MLVVSAILIAGVAGCASTPVPTEQIAVSKAAVTSATRSGGNEYAPMELRSATEKLTRAEQAMAEENYALAKRLAEQAQVDARLAETKAGLARAQKALQDAEQSNRVLREELNRTTR